MSQVIKLKRKFECRIYKDFVCTLVNIYLICKQEIRNCNREKKQKIVIKRQEQENKQDWMHLIISEFKYVGV